MEIRFVGLLLGAITLSGLGQSGPATVDVYRPEVRTITASDELQITVYDEAHLSREMVLDALDRLRLILQWAKIANRPVVGNPDDREASLFVYVAPPRRSEQHRTACSERRDITLKIENSSPNSLAQEVLGMSSPFAAFGVSVRVFNDHIREAALRQHLPHSIVLSYVMAHEIGHVLLKSGFHSKCGIMSSVWTKQEYEQMAHAALVFSDDEAKTMLANIGAPLCDTPNHRPTWAKPSSGDARCQTEPVERDFLTECRPQAVSPEQTAAVVQSLPRDGAITIFTATQSAKLGALGAILRVYQREHVYQIRVIDVPQAWTGLDGKAVLLISKPALDLLSVTELQALAAHEAAHEYLFAAYEAARAAQDESRLREIEEDCDRIAVFALAQIGIPPARLASAVEKVYRYNRAHFGIALNEGSYPALKDRLHRIR